MKFIGESNVGVEMTQKSSFVISSQLRVHDLCVLLVPHEWEIPTTLVDYIYVGNCYFGVKEIVRNLFFLGTCYVMGWPGNIVAPC